MKNNIWLINHYATSMYFEEGGRHYWLSKELIKQGYNVTIFCSSIGHNNGENVVMESELFEQRVKENILFTFIKTNSYKSNGIMRVVNMLLFYKNLIKTAREFKKKGILPDIVVASSVHPLSLVAGLKISKLFNIKTISEIRDLWPESIVAYSSLKRESFIAKIMYMGEKWIYKKSDSIVMTWAGGKKYIKNQKWEDEIELSKVHHISNGINLQDFDYNKKKYVYKDYHLDNKKYLNFVYTGSIRKVNNLSLLLEIAKILNIEKINIRFLIFGSGDELEELQRRVKEEKITNFILKGKVEKKYIASIISKSDVNILHNESTSLNQYGSSQNKLFEYLAAGNPILQTYSNDYSVLEEYKCGLSAKNQNIDEIINTIKILISDKDLMEEMGYNSREAAKNFDFKLLAQKYIDIIEEL